MKLRNPKYKIAGKIDKQSYHKKQERNTKNKSKIYLSVDKVKYGKKYPATEQAAEKKVSVISQAPCKATKKALIGRKFI